MNQLRCLRRSALVTSQSDIVKLRAERGRIVMEHGQIRSTRAIGWFGPHGRASSSRHAHIYTFVTLLINRQSF